MPSRGMFGRRDDDIRMERDVAGRSRVVILNGVGSVGKTSTARALQQIAAGPMLHVAMDAFVSMLPERMLGDPEGMVFETHEVDGRPSIAIRSGPVMTRTMKGMRYAIAAMAGQGIDLIVDEVMLGEGVAEEYRTLLAPFDLRVVGLFASLEVLEDRERARGDRELGLARWQYDRVHRGQTYDLELDTTFTTPIACAERIRDAFRL